MTISKDLHYSKGYWGAEFNDVNYSAITGSKILKIEKLNKS
jgi:hypothetical protein